jgi:hypothetical protein
MGKKINELTSATAAAADLLELSRLSPTVTITASTISAAAADNSYNDSGSGFVAAGFTVGMSVKVTGFTGNAANNIFTGRITALTTGKMTIGGTDGDVIVDDAAGESVTITAWESVRSTAQSVAGQSAAANLTDHAIVRGDGGAKGVQTSGVIVSDTDELSGYLANINYQTGTSYTVDVAGSDTDAGKIIDHANGSAIAVTLPATAPAGFACTYVQAGAGQITFASTGSGTLVNRQSHTKSAGANAMVALYVRANAGGSAAVWVMGGDTAA